MARRTTVSVECPGKLNLFLEVPGRRPDGFHEIATVMVAVSLADTLELREASRDAFEVEPAGAAPADASNTVLKALSALRRRVRVPPVHVRLVKRVPSGAGMGGGSSDAAGLVRAADRRFSLDLGAIGMRSVLAEVGSDTSFFATGGAALCTGRGEVVQPLAYAPRFAAVVLAPPVENPTREVYARLRLNLTARPRSVTEFLNSLSAGDESRLGESLYNRLEPPAFEWRPELRRLKRGLSALGFQGVLMTGSGSALFGLCRPGELRGREREVRSKRWGRVFAVTPAGSND